VPGGLSLSHPAPAEPSAQQVDGDESVDRTEDVMRRRGRAIEANLGRRLYVIECPLATAVPERGREKTPIAATRASPITSSAAAAM